MADFGETAVQDSNLSIHFDHFYSFCIPWVMIQFMY